MTKVFPIQQISRDDVYTETLAVELRVTDLRATTAKEPPTPRAVTPWDSQTQPSSPPNPYASEDIEY